MSAKSSIIRFAGDINVAKITITSLITNKEFNVSNQLLSFQVFEDLFSPFITGNLIFKESLDFASNFPFVGEEIIDLEFYTPTFDTDRPKDGVIKGRFYIYKMADRQEVAERNTVYQLHFISIEAVDDLNNKISKGFDGKISDIALSLIKDEVGLMTDKKANIEETSNKIKYVSNFWSPIKNINFLLQNAQDVNESPTYTFYENRFGFNFISLDTLNGQKPYQTFQQYNIQQETDPSGSSVRNLELDYRKISELSIPTSYDYMDRVTSGTYGSQILFVDIAKKEYYNQKYTFFDKWGKDGSEKRLNEFPLASNKIYTTYRSTMYNDVIENTLFTDYEEVSNVRFRQKRISRLKQAEGNKIQIVVPGRTDYTVGQVVTINKFKSEPIEKSDDSKDLLDKLISGNYLISSINHLVGIDKHECHMTLIKDSLILDLNRPVT